MSDAEPRDPSSLNLAVRDALVDRLLADLAAPGGAAAVGAALRDVAALDGDGDVAAPPDLTVLAGDPAQRRRAREVLLSYRAALARVPRGEDLATRLAQARVLFAAALYFEVHEVLEPPWREATGEPRRILQGIIQAAVAWHHGARGRGAPALRKAEAASAKLTDAPDAWNGFPIAALRALLDEYRRAVERGALPTPPPGF
ncbi:MAG: DUF309 domain-containing protein [Candidatus Binatia bacterium]